MLWFRITTSRRLVDCISRGGGLLDIGNLQGGRSAKGSIRSLFVDTLIVDAVWKAVQLKQCNCELWC